MDPTSSAAKEKLAVVAVVLDGGPAVIEVLGGVVSPGPVGTSGSPGFAGDAGVFPADAGGGASRAPGFPRRTRTRRRSPIPIRARWPFLQPGRDCAPEVAPRHPESARREDSVDEEREGAWRSSAMANPLLAVAATTSTTTVALNQPRALTDRLLFPFVLIG